MLILNVSYLEAQKDLFNITKLNGHFLSSINFVTDFLSNTFQYPQSDTIVNDQH